MKYTDTTGRAWTIQRDTMRGDFYIDDDGGGSVLVSGVTEEACIDEIEEWQRSRLTAPTHAIYRWERDDRTRCGEDVVCAQCQANPAVQADYAGDERREVSRDDADERVMYHLDNYGRRRSLVRELFCSLCDTCVFYEDREAD